MSISVSGVAGENAHRQDICIAFERSTRQFSSLGAEFNGPLLHHLPQVLQSDAHPADLRNARTDCVAFLLVTPHCCRI